MGIDDRGYMRERYRQRQGLPPERTTWNERKARREMPAGSPWFEKKNRGHDYQRGRWRPRGRIALYRGALVASMLVVLLVVGIGGRSWFADQLVATILSEGRSFPASGTVSVPANIDMKRVVARLTVQGGPENAIVQMIDATTGRNALSIYVRSHERVTVPVPVGRFHMRLVHGREWTDSRALFGKGTLHDEIAGVMRFSRTIGHVLDLRLGEDSNLVMRRIALPPAPLA